MTFWTGMTCGCGKPAEYVSPANPNEGSCNKYNRCPTYEELKVFAARKQRVLNLYQQAIDVIDDYFEYRCESKKDQRKIHQILENLTEELKAQNESN